MDSTPPPARRLLPPLLIAGLTFAAFLPSLQGEFLNWDDDAMYLFNPHYRGLGWSNLRWMFSDHFGHFMPITWLTLGLDYVLWGMNPTGYHAVNMAFHALNAVLLYFLLRRILRRARPDILPDVLDRAAAVGALFFSVHPLRVESVAWLTERRDVVSCAFFLGSLLAYVRAAEAEETGRPRRRWLVLSVLLFTGMLLSKTMGFTLPLAMLVMDVYPLRRFPRVSIRNLLLEKVPFFVLMGASTVMIAMSVDKADAFYSRDDYPLIQSIAQPGSKLWFYIGKTLLPINLSPLYWFRPHLGYSQVIGWLGLLGTGAALVAFRRRHPAALAAFLCFGLFIAPTSGIVQVGPQIAADRYTYVPCLPFAALVAGLWILLAERFSPRVAVAAGAVLLAALGFLTVRQCGIWKDSVALWTRAIDLEPDVYFTRDRRGQAFAARRDWDRALSDLDLSVQLNGGWFESRVHRARTRLQTGNPVGALEDANEAIRLNPGLGDAYLARGLAFSRIGRSPEAVEDFSSALKRRPRFAEAHVNRALELAKLGDLSGARSDFDAALSLDPQPHAYLRRATLRGMQGDLDGAIADCTEALRLKPDFVDAYMRRGVAHMERGDSKGAADDFSRALAAAPPSWPGRAQAEEFLRQARAASPK